MHAFLPSSEVLNTNLHLTHRLVSKTVPGRLFQGNFRDGNISIRAGGLYWIFFFGAEGTERSRLRSRLCALCSLTRLHPCMEFWVGGRVPSRAVGTQCALCSECALLSAQCDGALCKNNVRIAVVADTWRNNELLPSCSWSSGSCSRHWPQDSGQSGRPRSKYLEFKDFVGKT